MYLKIDQVLHLLDILTVMSYHTTPEYRNIQTFIIIGVGLSASWNKNDFEKNAFTVSICL